MRAGPSAIGQRAAPGAAERAFWLRAAKVALVGLLCAGLCWLAYAWSKELLLEQARQQARATLALYTQSLKGELRKYEVLPEILASRREIIQLFRQRDAPDAVERANRLAESVNDMSGAADTYFMDVKGLTFAASNWNSDQPFVGRNFSYRPYFQQAIEGSLGRYFALGTTSNRRGYYFAYPVREGEDILGVVAVKVNVKRIEASWAAAPNEVMVTDGNGVVFIASREGWRFKTLGPLSPAAIAEIESNRQYRLDDLRPLESDWQGNGDVEQVSIREAGAQGASASVTDYLVESRTLSEAGWTVHVLTDSSLASGQAAWAPALTALACLIAVLILALARQRRRRLIERIEIERAGAERLEQRVRERTADLTASNLRLEEEIRERRSAEEALRRTQDELIQAGKLAALGQMSAAISHEFNQPLAAIRSYAENAGTLIARDRLDEAGDNCTRIWELTGRMAEISKHLNAFARKPRRRLIPVSPAAVVEETLKFLKGRLDSAEADVSFTPGDADLQVMAGPLRLQQVMTNLLLNALDAMSGSEAPRIDIALSSRNDRLLLSVRDHGPGIDEAQLDRIFDPFFTTKEVGSGLGLGLSISYNIIKDFDGSLRAENHPDGGALFTVELPLLEADSSTAGTAGTADGALRRASGF